LINTAYMRVFVLFHFPPNHRSAPTTTLSRYTAEILYIVKIYLRTSKYNVKIYGGNIVHRLKYITGINLNAFRLRSNYPAILVGVVPYPELGFKSAMVR